MKIFSFLHKKNQCPYCNTLVKINIIKTEFKCINCSNIIYIKIINNQKIFITEDNARLIDKKLDRRLFEEKYISIFKKFGINRLAYLHRKKRWLIINRYKNSEDLYLSILKELEKNFLIKNNFSKLRSVYYYMAVLMAETEKDCHSVLKQAALMQLMDFKKLGFNIKIKILTNKDKSCIECKKNEGKIYEIHEAIAKMPIPNPNCKTNFRFCKCRYIIENQDINSF